MKQLLFILIAVFTIASCTRDTSGNDSDSNPNQTLSGSYAKILKVKNSIYAIDESKLVTFAVTPEGVDKIDTQDVGFNIENIYNHDNLLFIGSQTGMYIYVIQSNGVPAQQSITNYVFESDVYPCVPVIAVKSHAYITLSTTTDPQSSCFRSTPVNQLRIYDVIDITKPTLVSTTELDGPKGLGIKGNNLFVCDGKNGFKVFDITDKQEPKLINTVGDYRAYDLIVNENKLSVISETELKQYDITDVENIKEYSTIILAEI